MVTNCHVGYPLAVDQAHAQTMQSLQIMLHKHAHNFKGVHGYLLPVLVPWLRYLFLASPIFHDEITYFHFNLGVIGIYDQQNSKLY